MPLPGRMRLLLLAPLLSGCAMAPPSPSAGPLPATRVADLARPATVLVQTKYEAKLKVRQPELSNTATAEAFLTALKKLVDDREFVDEDEFRNFVAEHKDDFVREFLQELAVNFDRYFVPGDPQEETVELGFRGSGCVVSPAGHVITNAHVAAPTDEELTDHILEQRRVKLDQELRESLDEVASGRSGISFELTDVSRNLGTAIRTFLLRHSEVKITRREVRVVQTGASVKSGTVASVVAQGKAVPGKDVAILKIDGANLYALPLADGQSQSGEKVYAVGFPGVAMLKSIMTEEAETEPTFQEGSVSGNKSMSEGWKAIQTTLPASPGQSGGPVLDNTGHVVGIMTFGISDSESGARAEQLGYVVPTEVVKEFLHQASITPEPGRTAKHYRQALTNGDHGFYRLAQKELLEIDGLGIEHPDFTRKLAEYGSRTPQSQEWKLWIPAFASGGAGVLVMLVGTGIWLHRRRLRKAAAPKAAPGPLEPGSPERGAPAAAAATPTAMQLQLEGTTLPLPLVPGERFTEQQIPGMSSRQGNTVVAEVVGDPHNPGRLGLRNLSVTEWQVFTDHVVGYSVVPPDQIAELVPASTFCFGTLNGVIQG